MSAESMLKTWRELVEPAVTRAPEHEHLEGETDYYGGPEEPTRPLGEEERTWPGGDRLPTVEKGESDADEQC